MRRKSKKMKDETKESSSERRSKRASSRRKKPYEDDEGGSGVEEGRTTEEEVMTPTKTKDRGSRRYATRGRRQKAEESEEEEVSQAEEERVECEEESGNNIVAEDQLAESGEDSKELKTADADIDKLEGNDGASTCKSDSQIWEMKNEQEKRGGIVEETPAPGEGDDGEEEEPRSHSRKRKLKLSRECLHENREAIPKIRLRLSRNRSGGYETEKVEAERIETKKAEEEAASGVTKLETVSEEVTTGDIESSITAEPSEVSESVSEKEPEVEIIEKAEQDSPEEVEEIKTEEPIVEEVQTETKESPTAEVEVLDSPVVETHVEGEKVDSPAEKVDSSAEKVDSPAEIEEISTNEAEPAVSDDKSLPVEAVVESPKNCAEERTEPEKEVKMDVESVPTEEKEQDTVLPFVEESTVPETDEQDSEKEALVENKAQNSEEEERRDAEEVQEKQVSQVSEVSDCVVKECEESRPGDIEKPKDCEKEDSEDEVKGVSEKVVEEKESSKVDEISETKDTEQTELMNKDDDECSKDGKAIVDTPSIEEKVPNEGDSESMDVPKDNEDRPQKSGNGERANRLNRTKLRQDEDISEELQNQKRRRKRRSLSRESSGSGSQQKQPTTLVASEQIQPKRVSLKRPKLIRSTSIVPIKEASATDEKEQKDEVNASVKEKEEEDTQASVLEEAPPSDDKEVNQEESKPDDQTTSTEEGIKRRRRKWCQQKNQGGPSQSKRAFISISTQSLKGLIPEVKPLPIHELRLSVEKDDIKDICMEEEESCEASVDETIVRMIDANGQNERTIWAQVVDDEMRPAVHPDTPRIPLVGGDVATSTGPVRRISIVSDDALRLQRSPSPPRHPPSNVLFLSNLVRPFTVQQLKELLARTGTVVDGGFWIDRIKSMCLVQYETEEQARETRHALHGVRWPISNPKRLWVDFATQERLEEAKREGNVAAPAAASGPSLTPPHPAPRDDFPRKTEPLRLDGSGMMPIHHSNLRGAPGSPGRQGHAMILQQGPIIGGGPGAENVATDNVGWQQRGRPRPEAPPLRPGANARDFKLSAPVREWDLDKVVQQSPPRPGIHGPSRGPMDERRRPDTTVQAGGRRERMFPSPVASIQELQARKAKRKEAEAAAAAAAEAPANLLDSLFRKTKATPSIYWLPLTADQIKVKEEIRRQHLAEHERRMAEMKRAADKERGGRRRRRSSSPRRRSRRRSGEGSSTVRKKPSESLKGHKAGSTSPKK